MTIDEINASIASEEGKIFLLSCGTPTSKLAMRLEASGWQFLRGGDGRRVARNKEGIDVVVRADRLSLLATLAGMKGL